MVDLENSQKQQQQQQVEAQQSLDGFTNEDVFGEHMDQVSNKN